MNKNEIIHQVNNVRVEANLNPLKENSALNETAAIRAKELCRTNSSSHDNWLESIRGRYNYKLVGENLAKNYVDTTSAVDAWVASPTHYDNIAEERFTETGVAVKSCGGNTYAVQHFGLPAEVQVASSSLSFVPALVFVGVFFLGVILAQFTRK